MKHPSDETIKYLQYLTRSYDGIVRQTTAIKNRFQALLPEADLKHQDEIKILDSLKGKLLRKMKNELKIWPVWDEWMVDIPGIGPFIGANLVLLYYYRFMPRCQKCGGSKLNKKEIDGRNKMICLDCDTVLKDDPGRMQYAVEYKDFANISKWWKYMGEHNVDGLKPKRQKGKLVDWSPKGRQISYNIGDQFNRQSEDHLYKAFLLIRKKKRENTHPDASKGHRLNMAKRESSKLFLAHFWTVARTLDGLTVTEPYAGTIMGHTNIIDPFYWNVKRLRKAA